MNDVKIKKIIITTGGTGGHIIPGITIAKFLIKNGWEVKWIGTKEKMESFLVPRNNIDIKYIKIINILKCKWYSLFYNVFINLNSIFKLIFFIIKYKPNILLGMGNYISVPGVIAAWICRVPIILHEQNITSGISNKILSKISNKVLQAFSGDLFNAKIVGNPIRNEIINISKSNLLIKKDFPLKILVLGGSQGSELFNNVIPEVSYFLKDKIIVWHQTGKGKLNYTKNLYLFYKQKNYKLSEFIENIHIAYKWTDVLICRSGALTISEIACVGIPSLIIPLESKNKHQYYNALQLKKIGAAEIINSNEFTVFNIINIILKLDLKKRMYMSKNIKNFSNKNSTKIIFKEILNVIKKCK